MQAKRRVVARAGAAAKREADAPGIWGLWALCLSTSRRASAEVLTAEAGPKARKRKRS